MQITNNYQPNFRAGRINRSALKVLSERLKSGEFQPFVDKFKERHNTDEYDLLLGTLKEDCPRLDACITYDESHFRHISEGLFSSLFLSPKRFMNKINRQIDKDSVSIATNGHISTPFWKKLSYFFL